VSNYTISHLRQLEAESIYIIREVAAEFNNPVMLYSIGKDSSVMLRLAQKAFHPAKIPFPLMHVDTTWKFKEMIAFRERMAKEIGFDLKVWINPEGQAMGMNPIDYGSEKHTQVMKTDALKQALNHYGYDAAFGGARRDEEKSRAKERVYSFRNKHHQSLIFKARHQQVILTPNREIVDAETSFGQKRCLPHLNPRKIPTPLM